MFFDGLRPFTVVLVRRVRAHVLTIQNVQNVCKTLVMFLKDCVNHFSVISLQGSDLYTSFSPLSMILIKVENKEQNQKMPEKQD